MAPKRAAMSSEPSLVEARAALRRAHIQRRRELPLGVQQQASEALAERLVPLLHDARVIGVYAAIRGEISLDPLLRTLPDRRWCWPKVGDEQKLHFVEATPYELSSGAYGILEPPTRECTPLLTLDAILVPGSAFTRDGGRLGMGGGFYDRVLPLLRTDCPILGVGYDWQVVDTLPLLPHDHKMTYVVTDLRTLLCAPEPLAAGDSP